MSNFHCDKCGAYCEDSPRGFTSGCEHYPPDIQPLRGFGMTLNAGHARKWYVDKYGQKRWADNDKPCLSNTEVSSAS